MELLALTTDDDQNIRPDIRRDKGQETGRYLLRNRVGGTLVTQMAIEQASKP
jgi:hypothetical protein